jgi:3-oxoacyl-[acyl-carrier-protein] synthase-3
VFKFAVKQVPSVIKELLQEMEKTADDIDLFLLHQANRRILTSVAKRIGTDMDKVPVNLHEYGNTSSASIPILLDEVVRDGRIKAGDRVIMAGFGAGLTWAATYLIF